MAAKNGAEGGGAVKADQLSDFVHAFTLVAQHALGSPDTQFGDIAHHGRVVGGSENPVQVKSRNVEMIGQHLHGKRYVQVVMNVVDKIVA